jgi:hypothetical protein
MQRLMIRLDYLYKDANGDAPAYADLRFLGGTMAALYLHFNEGGLSPLAVNACRDISVGLLSSFVATETCRAAAVKRMLDSKIEQEAYGSPNIHIEEDSEDNWVDDPNLEDIYGMETSLEEEQVSYAYGW